MVRIAWENRDELPLACAFLRVASGFSRTFLVSTRRGKQFNSMIQRDVDPLTGAGHDDIFISADDLQIVGLDDGAADELLSGYGMFTGRLKSRWRSHLRRLLRRPRNLTPERGARRQQHD